MKNPLLFVAALLLSGCVTTDEAYRDYLTAQHRATEMTLAQQKPLVELVALPGQQITGLSALRVYTPAVVPAVQQARPNEWVGVIERAIGVGGTVLGLKISTDGSRDLVNAVGAAVGQGYQYVNPTPIVAPEVQVVRPEVVQTPAPVVVRPEVVQPDVIQVPTQVIPAAPVTPGP